jgi:Ni/Fe-hydrogenase subunit HybB-like protein
MIALQYLTGAGWSIALRRINEAMSGLLIPGLIGIAAVLILRPSLYPWTTEAFGDHGFAGFKVYWLNHTNWLVRAAIYAGIWLSFSFALRWHSRRQDVDGEFSHTRWNVALSAMFVICFALSYWLASVDWLMSLEPLWFSTMYGVYNFAGLLSGGVACTIVVAVWLRNRGTLRGVIKDDHLHDLGKLLLAFTTFWAYIWFSEYMLIWYANIPEETEHFIRRTHNLWMPLFYLNVGLNWVIPFLVLLPRAGKRDGSFLVKIALIVLLGRVLDMYLLIIPTVSASTPFAGFAPLGITLGAIGVVVLCLGRSLGESALVPLKDPYLDESLHHHI